MILNSYESIFDLEEQSGKRFPKESFNSLIQSNNWPNPPTHSERRISTLREIISLG
jgi:hypothetical protein